MMKKKCQKCGHDYTPCQLAFDSGLCRQCKPRFFGPPCWAPLWMQPVQAGTRDLWKALWVVHGVLFVLFGLLLDSGELSTPGGVYCLTIVLYLAVRFAIARFKGYPVLTKCQRVAFVLLPIWGPCLSVSLFHWAQRARWGI